MEKDKALDYAMQLNLTAQLRAVDLSLPLMPRGGRIIFVTSHLAHFYGQKPVSPIVYEPVAQSKKAGEEALRSRIAELATRGIKLLVVSGDLIEGTITLNSCNVITLVPQGGSQKSKVKSQKYYGIGFLGI